MSCPYELVCDSLIRTTSHSGIELQLQIGLSCGKGMETDKGEGHR